VADVIQLNQLLWPEHQVAS